MKHFVINLERREDRKNKFTANNRGKFEFEFVNAVDGSKLKLENLESKGIIPSKTWKDGDGKGITDGEIGCFLSHYGLWQKCVALNEPICIIEDDIIVNVEDYHKAFDCKDSDFTYISWKEMDSEKQKTVDEDFVIPGYAWNLSAYIITPKAAKELISTNVLKDIIPADDYVPRMSAKNVFKTKAIKNTKSTAYYVVSDVTLHIPENASSTNAREFYASDIYVITVGTDESMMRCLKRSAKENNVKYINLGKDKEWNGGINGELTGGGQKLNLVREFIKDKDKDDYILFVDAYDVFFTSGIDEIFNRFLEWEVDALFGAENTCWPNEELAKYFDDEKPYPYLNSGTYIAKVSKLLEMLKEPLQDFDDDQEYLQKAYLKSENVALDHEQYIFMTSDADNLTVLNGDSFNRYTNCFGCIVHGNGGSEEKKNWRSLYDEIFEGKRSALYIPNYGNYDIISDDMLVIRFMTKDQCDKLIEISENHGGWDPMPGDKFPAYEIRMKELGLWQELEEHWINHVYPVVEEFWHPLQMYGLRDAFTMRYSLDTQTSLNNHHDASLVTGSVKLNDDYAGAELIFPRQGVTNTQVNVGDCILFPGQVTHGHYCNELVSGVKYSLTMWTSRYNGDVN